MSPKIHATFWSDDGVGDLPADQKLAFLWLITNRSTNNIGFVVVSRREFTHDTGSPFEVLEGLLKALPRAFVATVEDGQLKVWIRKFIAHQWAPGELADKSHIRKHLLGLAARLPKAFREPFAQEYKALARALEWLNSDEASPLASPTKPHASPLEGPSSPLQGARAEQSRAENLSGGSGGIPDAQAPSWKEVEAFAAAYPGDLATGAPPFQSQEARTWLRRWFDFRDNSRRSGWDSLRDWKKALEAEWRREFRGVFEKKAASPNVRTDAGSGGVWALKQRLDAVRTEIAEHPAREGSRAYAGDGLVTPEMEADLDRLRKEAAELERRIRS